MQFRDKTAKLLKDSEQAHATQKKKAANGKSFTLKDCLLIFLGGCLFTAFLTALSVFQSH